MEKEFIKWFQENRVRLICTYRAKGIAHAAWLAAKERYELKESFIAKAIYAKSIKK